MIRSLKSSCKKKVSYQGFEFIVEHSGCYSYTVEVFLSDCLIAKYLVSGHACATSHWAQEIAEFLYSQKYSR